MSHDPIVDEVRAIREAYAKKFNYDLNAIYRDLKKKEKKRHNVVSLRPRRTAASRKAAL